MGKVIQISLAILLSPLSFSQPVGSIAAPPAPPSGLDSKEGAEAAIPPSRLVTDEDLPIYIQKLTATFSMKGRTTDPFGRSQDPDAKPVVIARAVSAVQRAPQVQITSFTEVVRMIPITTIMPKEKRFLLGTRSIAQGDEVSLRLRGKNIRVQVTTVTSRQIDFRNQETGEKATRKLDLLPPGMTAGAAPATAPGMAPDRADAPIDLVPENSQF